MTESYSTGRSKPFMRLALGAGIFVAGMGIALAAPPQPASPEAAKYGACVAKVNTAPEAALDMATSWRASGGGVAAQHCIALALVGLGKYAEGAKRLEEVAEELQTGHGALGMDEADNRRLLPEVYGQAGNAWLMAGNYSRAYNMISAGLGDTPPWTPRYGDLLLDRASALAGMGQYDKALADLDKAQEAAPNRADIRISRAAMLRALNRLAEAAADLSAALKLEPDNPEALLERGELYLATGDAGAARADWSKVVTTYPGTPEAEAAQKNIAKLQGKANPPPAPTHP